ncbi:unnamed protein product [Adineta steineri]|uniref:Glycosyl hydrolase family 13 catalytic domain-containing protein n=1 Tax=Adineta steineri TaxID=433720 RepID=A0A819IWD1_9BILA|nr:unnamed protein product [Adineta steineri]
MSTSPIEFKLFAPNNKQVELLIAHTQDRPSRQRIPMVKDDQTGYFHCQVSNLQDGDYEYRFHLQTCSPNHKPDEWLDVIDPCVTQYDAINDEGIVTVKQGRRLTSGCDDYQWRNDHIKLPENKDIIIYELYISDFTDEGTLNAIIDTGKLDYLSQELGINAIELMPIQESMGMAHDWGYSTRHYFALKHSYGSPEDLKRFVDECHGRGIRVILDGVYTFSNNDCPLLQIDKNYWYYADRHHPDDPNYWGPEFNYEYYDDRLKIKPACDYISAVANYWLAEYHLDAIRFDSVKELDNFDILRRLVSECTEKRAPQPFLTIAEYIPDTSKIVKCGGGPLDSCWSTAFHMDIISNLMNDTEFSLDKIKRCLDIRQQGYSSPLALVNYISSHDNQHMLFQLQQHHIMNDDAFERLELAAILLMTALGIPMIWMGTELGEARESTSDQHQKDRKTNWQVLDAPVSPYRTLLNTFKQVIKLRRQLTALRSDNLEFFFEHYDDRVLAYSRRSNDNDLVLVIAHFSPNNRDGYIVKNIPAKEGTQFVNGMDENEVLHIENGTNELKMNLKPFEGKILIQK